MLMIKHKDNMYTSIYSIKINLNPVCWGKETLRICRTVAHEGHNFIVLNRAMTNKALWNSLNQLRNFVQMIWQLKKMFFKIKLFYLLLFFHLI